MDGLGKKVRSVGDDSRRILKIGICDGIWIVWLTPSPYLRPFELKLGEDRCVLSHGLFGVFRAECLGDDAAAG